MFCRAGTLCNRVVKQLHSLPTRFTAIPQRCPQTAFGVSSPCATSHAVHRKERYAVRNSRTFSGSLVPAAPKTCTTA